MVAEFVGDDIRLSKIARCFEFPLKLIEIRKIEVKFVIAWAVERASRRTRVAAGGRDLFCKQHKFRSLKLYVGLRRQYLFPRILEVAHDRTSEFTVFIRWPGGRISDGSRRGNIRLRWPILQE